MSVDELTNQPTTETPPVLRRSHSDRVIAGVCGGLGRYLGVDPVILRIGFVVLTVFGGAGIVLYIIALIAIPEEAAGDNIGDAAGGSTAGRNGAVLFGALLVAVGSLLLVNRLLPGFDAWFGPLLLVGMGAAIILGVRR